ncbi:MAG: hypothetical protein ACRCTO_16960, partial [Pseudomonas paracarnis]
VGLALTPGRAYRIKNQSLGHDILEPLWVCAPTLGPIDTVSMTDALIAFDPLARTNGRFLREMPD